MADTRVINPQTYINTLLTGDTSQLIIESTLPTVVDDDLKYFKEFLIDNGNPAPQPDDLFQRIKRDDFLTMLRYAKTNKCLILQNCFGFDKSIDKGGQMQLIQKGNMWMPSGITDAKVIFNTVYKTTKPTGAGAAETEAYELFLNMNPDSTLSVDTARQYIKNVRDYYPEDLQPGHESTSGYLFPVNALLAKFENDPALFSGADMLTFQWGLTSYSSVSMGSFTIVIGTGDVRTGDVLVFRSVGITGQVTNASAYDCPPHPGCRL